LKTKLEHFGLEEMGSVQENLDALLQVEKDVTDKKLYKDVEIQELHHLNARHAGSSLGMTEQAIDEMIKATVQKGSTPQQIADAKKAVNSMIIEAVEKQQDLEFWRHINNVDTTRLADNWTTGNMEHEINDKEAYEKVLATGSTKGVNKRLDWLRDESVQEAIPATVSREEGVNTLPIREQVLRHAAQQVESIDQTEPSEFGKLEESAVLPSQADIAKAINELGASGGPLDAGRFDTMLTESINKLSTFIERLPKELKEGMGTSFNEMQIMAHSGGINTQEDQLKKYYVLKGIQASLEKQRQNQEKKQAREQHKDEEEN
jgi:hypothetical protein